LSNHTQLLTPKEVAAVLRLRECTLATWRCTGRADLPYVKIGRSVRYTADAVAAYIASREMVHTGYPSAR